MLGLRINADTNIASNTFLTGVCTGEGGSEDRNPVPNMAIIIVQDDANPVPVTITDVY